MFDAELMIRAAVRQLVVALLDLARTLAAGSILLLVGARFGLRPPSPWVP